MAKFPLHLTVLFAETFFNCEYSRKSSISISLTPISYFIISLLNIEATIVPWLLYIVLIVETRIELFPSTERCKEYKYCTTRSEIPTKMSWPQTPVLYPFFQIMHISKGMYNQRKTRYGYWLSDEFYLMVSHWWEESSGMNILRVQKTKKNKSNIITCSIPTAVIFKPLLCW